MPKNCPFDKNFKVININFVDIASGFLPQASFQKDRYSSQSDLYHLRTVQSDSMEKSEFVVFVVN